jgi:uncharacterized membrane protein
VFDDPDASHGKAAGADKVLRQCCTGGYLNDLSPGRYKISVRMKLTHPVSGGGQMSVYENITCPGPTWKERAGSRIQKSFSTTQLGNDYRVLELTDQYEHHGIGFLTLFVHFGFPADAPADARFMVDWIRAERLESYTDQSIAAKAPIDIIPFSGVGPRNRVLWIRGMYDNLYRIDRSLEMAMPGATVDRCYQRHMPKAGQLSAYGTIILPNVPVDKMSLQERMAYRDWTLAGGHLVILGGDYSLGQGLMRNTFFEELLPCRLVRNDDVAALPESSSVQAVKPFWQKLRKSEFRDKLYFAHVTEAKPDARVTAVCGSLPLLMTRTAGKGRCTVFAGTVLGAPEDDPDAFWNGTEWPALLGRALE